MLLTKILLYGLAITLPFHQQQEATPRKVEKNGMTMEWTFTDALFQCKVSAPGTGWVAIGFNPEAGLTGTNLIMGAVRDGNCTLSDRYILQPGNHKSISNLGGQELLTQIKGQESKGTTTLEFCLPIQSNDQYHYPLTRGQSYHLLLAYSTSDDFDHHSIMRTSVYITL